MPRGRCSVAQQCRGLCDVRINLRGNCLSLPRPSPALPLQVESVIVLPSLLLVCPENRTGKGHLWLNHILLAVPTNVHSG